MVFFPSCMYLLVCNSVYGVVLFVIYDCMTVRACVCVCVGKCVEVQGTVVRVSNIKPLVTTLCFRCALCRTTQALVLTDGKYSPPAKVSINGCPSHTL